jgi:hypothetical protein
VDGLWGGSTPPARAGEARLGVAGLGTTWSGWAWVRKDNSRMVAPVVRLHWRELGLGVARYGDARLGKAWAPSGRLNTER